MKLRKEFFIFSLLLSSLFTVTSCSSNYASENMNSSNVNTKGTNTENFLWEVKNGDSTVYMMGTFHITKENFTLGEKVWELFNSSDTLSVEMDLLETERLQNIVNAFSYYTNGDTVLDHLSENGKIRLEELSKSYGLKVEDIKTLTPFAISMNLNNMAMQRCRLMYPGADSLLLQKAKETNKPIVEIENPEEMYANFGKLSDEDQEKFYLMSMAHFDETVEKSAEFYECYLSGDENRFFTFIKENDATYMEGAEAYYNIMVKDRNIVMTESIKGYLQKPGKTFVAVGAAHFFGDDGIISLLEKDGYTVTKK